MLNFAELSALQYCTGNFSFSDSCARNFRSEDEILATSFAKPFAFAGEFLRNRRIIRNFLFEIGWLKSLANFRGAAELAFVLPALLQKLGGEFFFDFSQGNLGNLVGNLAGILWDFSNPQNKGSKISGKISEHFS